MTEVMVDQELLTCPICSDIFIDACDTSCGHTFCEFCLNSCLESRPDKCPVCSKDPSPVHPAFTIRSICEVLQPHKTSEDDGKTLESEKEMGNQKYYQNKYADAISHYNNAIDKVTNSSDPKNCVLFNNRAQCYIHLHQYKRALLDCEEAIRLNDSNVKAFMRKGLCLRQLGVFEESKSAYQKAAQLDTSNQWTEQIRDGLNSLPIFNKVSSSGNTSNQSSQQPQQQQQQQPNPNNYPRSNSMPSNTANPYQQFYYQQGQQPGQPPQGQQGQQFNNANYPNFNSQYARYSTQNYPGHYTVRSNPQQNGGYQQYYQQHQQQQPQPQQQAPAQPAQPPATSTTSTTSTSNVNNNNNSTGTTNPKNTSTTSEKKKSDCKQQ
ncbi:RING zinc finger-containing protein [Cavenderia fasciculata]|uniref:RING zinc finger-containing protein n=1 Tax=Cavenderia fasciculata TaxID=261658 RepID=F4Q1L2_CACFS|nr:RING zinc finger-containing protein [Cavenderia fasciculata]EGG18713.1 RING zinc finger-containing protein [Cavenderia fasciculata]|eukprot:XP_004366617.1 RING zinc finger-containing protein [Cavenderia fasciculata]